MPFVPMPKGGVTLSLQGLALLEAVEAGLVRQDPEGRGYEIGPFLRFWEAFSGWLPNRGRANPNEMQEILKMLNQQSEQAAGDGPDQG